MKADQIPPFKFGVKFSYNMSKSAKSCRNRNSMAHKKQKLFGPEQTRPCHWCGELLLFCKATIDHIIDRADGGGNGYTNMVIACDDCNQKRGLFNDKARRDIISREVALGRFNDYLMKKKERK